MYNGHILTDTLLHMDITDAINIAIYTEGRDYDVNEEEGYAQWLLWSRHDIERLRKYLRDYFGLGADIDPINLGDLRITRDMCAELIKLGIEPYEIHQRVNQAVVIPARTPHYVRIHDNLLLFALT